MHTRSITEEWVTSFGQYLRQEERSAGTIEKYLRDVRAFAAWLGGTPLTKEAAAPWKGGLLDQLYREAKVENVEYGETIAVTAVCTPKVLGQMAPFLVE